MTAFSEIFRRYIRPLAPIPTGMTPDLSKMRPFSALLFDVYGTLLISGAGDIGTGQEHSGQGQALQELLDRYGIDRSPANLGQALRQTILQAHDLGRQQGIDFPEVDIARIWQQVLAVEDPTRVSAFALEYELIVNPVYSMPGLEALLASCRNRQLALGLISNAQFFTPYLLEQFLGATLGQSGFDSRLVFFSWQWGYAKPSLFMFEKAITSLSAMGIAPESTLYVGNDMCNDVLPAQTLGFKTALFAGDRRALRIRPTDDRCQGVKPDLIVTDLRQLIAAATPAD